MKIIKWLSGIVLASGIILSITLSQASVGDFVIEDIKIGSINGAQASGYFGDLVSAIWTGPLSGVDLIGLNAKPNNGDDGFAWTLSGIRTESKAVAITAITEAMDNHLRKIEIISADDSTVTYRETLDGWISRASASEKFGTFVEDKWGDKRLVFRFAVRKGGGKYHYEIRGLRTLDAESAISDEIEAKANPSRMINIVGVVE
jgi:hypothetical protein